MQTGTEARLGNGAAEHPDDEPARELDFELDPPVEDNGKTYTTLHLQEPTGRQILRAEQELATAGNVYTMRLYQFSLLSQVSGVPRSAIEKMRISQIDEAANFLASLSAGGRATGRT